MTSMSSAMVRKYSACGKNIAVIRLLEPGYTVQQDQRVAGAGFLDRGTMAEIRRTVICAYSIQKKIVIDALCW
jgi:hypothetical protein